MEGDHSWHHIIDPKQPRQRGLPFQTHNPATHRNDGK